MQNGSLARNVQIMHGSYYTVCPIVKVYYERGSDGLTITFFFFIFGIEQNNSRHDAPSPLTFVPLHICHAVYANRSEFIVRINKIINIRSDT